MGRRRVQAGLHSSQTSLSRRAKPSRARAVAQRMPGHYLEYLPLLSRSIAGLAGAQTGLRQASTRPRAVAMCPEWACQSTIAISRFISLARNVMYMCASGDYFAQGARHKDVQSDDAALPNPSVGATISHHFYQGYLALWLFLPPCYCPCARRKSALIACCCREKCTCY